VYKINLEDYNLLTLKMSKLKCWNSKNKVYLHTLIILSLNVIAIMLKFSYKSKMVDGYQIKSKIKVTVNHLTQHSLKFHNHKLMFIPYFFNSIKPQISLSYFVLFILTKVMLTLKYTIKISFNTLFGRKCISVCKKRILYSLLNKELPWRQNLE
jgi:hypothetical protein